MSHLFDNNSQLSTQKTSCGDRNILPNECTKKLKLFKTVTFIEFLNFLKGINFYLLLLFLAKEHNSLAMAYDSLFTILIPGIT